MDTFVVRVYRSGQKSLPDDEHLRGVVEEISTGSQATFHDTTQLLSILSRGQHKAVDAVHPHSQPSPTEGGDK